MNELIHLIGPGGAGKSTVGAQLSRCLGLAFVDLDERFMATVGGIGECIDSKGYAAYAERNVAVYCSLSQEIERRTVMALSSGFMTYPPGIHRDYARVREEIVNSPTSFCLLPSLEFEVCVAEIVRRQMTRPFIRSSAKEEAVIRKRFGIHASLPVRQVTTLRPVDKICDELQQWLEALNERHPSAPAD